MDYSTQKSALCSLQSALYIHHPSLEYVRPYCSYSNMIQIIFHTICAPACAIMEY